MLTVIAIVVIALAFDYINGFHDAANSIATVVSTRVLTPRAAVAWAAFFNFIAFVVFPLHVAHTIGKGIIDPKIIDDAVLFGALGGAIAWNLITWSFGLPSSSSHALIGGVVGSAVAAAGFDAVLADGLVGKVLVPAVIAPVSAQKPPNGFSFVRRMPIVFTMRQPPESVPRPIASWHDTITQSGRGDFGPRCPLAISIAMMMPIVFWASFAP